MFLFSKIPKLEVVHSAGWPSGRQRSCRPHGTDVESCSVRPRTGLGSKVKVSDLQGKMVQSCAFFDAGLG